MYLKHSNLSLQSILRDAVVKNDGATIRKITNFAKSFYVFSAYFEVFLSLKNTIQVITIPLICGYSVRNVASQTRKTSRFSACSALYRSITDTCLSGFQLPTQRRIIACMMESSALLIV